MGLFDMAGSVAVGAVERFRAARARVADDRPTRVAPMLAAAAVCLGLATSWGKNDR